MPIYEYRCCQCDKGFEELVLSAHETVVCPACSSPQVQRQLSVFSSPGTRAAEAGTGGGCGCTPSTCGCH